MADKLLLLFKVGPMERSLAKGFLAMFSKGATDSELVKGIVMIQTEVIPYILTGEVPGRG